MSYWLIDPQLFLYAKGTGPDDVILRRCKKTVISSSSSSSSSSLVVPMKPDDFDFVKIVKNHLELIAYMIEWDEPDYNRLVKYIYEKRFLVNSQGLVIAELLHNADKYGKKTIDDAANEEDVPAAIYIRSLDVLPLKPYIPKLTERPIPLRMVKYLGDVNGKVAPMEEDSKVTKFTARVDNLEAENIKLTARVANLETENTRLESKNNTLDTNVSKLTADMVTQTNALDTSVTQFTAGLATITGNVVDLQSKNKTLEVENKTLDSNVKTLEGKVTKLTANLVTQMNALTTLQQQVENIINVSPKEAWMNDLTNSEWVSIERLQSAGPHIINNINQLGTFTVDDSSTNVRARYWYKINIFGTSSDNQYQAISLEDLTPNKERARFSLGTWDTLTFNGKTYVFRYIFRH